jgi:uncharacterized membrane protein (DUF106 family)
MRNFLGVIATIGVVAGVIYVGVQKLPITIYMLCGFVFAALCTGLIFDMKSMKERWAPIQDNLDEMKDAFERGKETELERLKAEKEAKKSGKHPRATEEEIEDAPPAEKPAETEKAKSEPRTIRRPPSGKPQVEAAG